MRKIIKKISPGFLIRLYQEYKKLHFIHISKKNINKYLSETNVTKLHIGAGGNKIQGWLNTDIDPIQSDIYYLDASKKFPIPDQSIDYIYSEHVFEHLTIDQQINMLSESYRILKPNGKIRIATPDFNFIMSIYNNPDKQIQEYINWNAEAFLSPLKGTFGDKIKTDVFVINNFFHGWGHQFIHNQFSLILFLEKFNFKDVNSKQIGQSDNEHLVNLEKHGEVITYKFNEMETIVLEGTK